MICNSLLGYFDSFYYPLYQQYPIYFNCDPHIQSLYSIKTSPNIILVNNENHLSPHNLVHQSTLDPQKVQQSKLDQIDRKIILEESHKNEQIKRFQKQAVTRKAKKITKPQKKSQMIQKQGRNSHSNILRKFFKLLSFQSQFANRINKIIQVNDFKITVNDYFNKIRSRNIDHRNYIRVKEVHSLFQNPQNPTNIITRILFQNYLKNYYIQHLLSSKKTDNKSVIFHLKGRRSIREEIFYQGETSN